MNLNLYDAALTRIAAIGNQFVSCYWSEGYNTMGAFSLELRATSTYKDKVKPGCFIGRTDRETLMVVSTVQTTGGLIIASGKPATRLLDDIAFVGTVAQDEVVANALKNAYNSSSGNPLITIADSDLPDVYSSQISNKSMLELFENLCQTSDIGFKAVRVGKTIEIQLYKPDISTNAKLSEIFGNLSSPQIAMSIENMRNYAIVLSTNSAGTQTRVDVDLTNGEDRKELIVEAGDITQEDGETTDAFHARLTARGRETLLARGKTWECSFEPLEKEFGVKYTLGDVLTVLLPDYGMRIQARVAKFTQKEQRNQTKTTLNVGSITILKG